MPTTSKIEKALKENGPMTVYQLTKEVDTDRKIVQHALRMMLNTYKDDSGRWHLGEP